MGYEACTGECAEWKAGPLRPPQNTSKRTHRRLTQRESCKETHTQRVSGGSLALATAPTMAEFSYQGPSQLLWATPSAMSLRLGMAVALERGKDPFPS